MTKPRFITKEVLSPVGVGEVKKSNLREPTHGGISASCPVADSMAFKTKHGGDLTCFDQSARNHPACPARDEGRPQEISTHIRNA